MIDKPSQLVKDLGEQKLLKILQQFCPQNVVGDDGALFRVEPGCSLVVTTDVLVDDVHFSDRTTNAIDVGWRAAAANLSDLAAMGAKPIGITVGLSLPGEVPLVWVEQMYQGLHLCMQHYGAEILGGDLCRSPTITVAITAFGQVADQRIILRSNARVGDKIVVTGIHGASRAGLELLLHPEMAAALDENRRNFLIKAHQRPQPRLDVLECLWQIKDLSRVAGMDSSDGLADAIIQICRCSNVGAIVDRNLIPQLSDLEQIVSPQQAWEWILYGGEDFELVLCLDDRAAQVLIDNLGKDAAIIGEIVAGDKVVLIDSNHFYPQRILSMTEGFQHF